MQISNDNSNNNNGPKKTRQIPGLTFRSIDRDTRKSVHKLEVDEMPLFDVVLPTHNLVMTEVEEMIHGIRTKVKKYVYKKTEGPAADKIGFSVGNVRSKLDRDGN